MNKVFILEIFDWDGSNIIYVASSLEKARGKAMELDWVPETEGFYYKADNGRDGSITEWEVDE